MGRQKEKMGRVLSLFPAAEQEQEREGRRSRVREVSSRFMSPLLSSSSSSHSIGDLHSSSKCPLPKHSAAHNLLLLSDVEETPFSPTKQKKKRSTAFKENARSTPDTPSYLSSCNNNNNNLHRTRRMTPKPTPPGSSHLSSSIDSTDSDSASSQELALVHVSPTLQSKQIHPLRSSTHTTNLSSSFNSPFSHPKSLYKLQPSFPSNSNPTSLHTNLLPSHTNKPTRVSTRSDDVHALRLLYNRYLQWRYANAKTEAAIHAQSISAQKLLHALLAKISELHGSVEKKYTKLEELKRGEKLDTILEAQIPYLDKWSALEEEYSSCISETVKALQDASLRLPIGGNVKGSIEDITGALRSVSNVMDSLFLLIESFLPKGEQMDSLISEVVGVVSRERALIEECGDLFTKMHTLQVEECSLRGQIIQLKQCISSEQAKAK